MRTLVVVVLSIAAIAGACAEASGATLKKEPAMGALRQGQRVLVDDGSCPKGQIKEVIGGNHTSVGGNSQIKRTRRCVQRK